MLEIFLEVFLAVFFVFGLYSAVLETKRLCSKILRSRRAHTIDKTANKHYNTDKQ